MADFSYSSEITITATPQKIFDIVSMTCTQLTIAVTLGNNRLDSHGLVFYGDSVDH